MREEDLVRQLGAILDQIDLNATSVKKKFEAELKRNNKFHRAVLGIKNPAIQFQEIDLKTYVQYILKDGTNEEKRELMGCFKSQVRITKRIVTIN